MVCPIDAKEKKCGAKKFKLDCLCKHMTSAHPDIYSSYVKRKAKNSLESEAKKPRRTLILNMVKFVTFKNLPFSIIQDTDFRDLFQNSVRVSCSVLLPGKTMFMSALVTVYEAIRTVLMDELKRVVAIGGQISISVDTWTTPHSNESFGGLVVSFINDKWELIVRPIKLSLFAGQKTSDRIREWTQHGLESFNLDFTKDFLSATADGAADMRKAFKFDLGLWCLVHRLNLAISESLGTVDKKTNLLMTDFYKAARRQATVFSQSPKADKALREIEAKRNAKVIFNSLLQYKKKYSE